MQTLRCAVLLPEQARKSLLHLAFHHPLAAEFKETGFIYGVRLATPMGISHIAIFILANKNKKSHQVAKMKLLAGVQAGLRGAKIRRWAVRHYLIALVAAALLPGIIGAGVLFYREYQEGKERLARDTILTARALTQTVDAYLLQAQVIALALSTDDSLAKREFRQFHKLASGVVSRTGIGNNVVLSDASGQQLVNTVRAYGEPLPLHGNPELVRQVLATGHPVISNLFIGAVLKKPLFSIDVPVFIGSKATYVLSVAVLPRQFETILKVQGLPESWVTAIFDASGTTVARTHAAEQYVGKKGAADFIQRIRETREGATESVTLEGIPTFSVYSRSQTTDWSVGIGIPRQELVDDLHTKLWRLAGVVIALFGVGCVLVLATGRRISRSVHSLKSLAVELGQGTLTSKPPFRIQEVEEIAQTMLEADAERRKAEEELHETTLRFQAAFKSGSLLIVEHDADLRFTWIYYPSKDFRPETLLGKLETEVTENLKDAEANMAVKRQVMASGVGDRREVRVVSAGKVLWFDQIIEPKYDTQGRIVGVICAAINITERKLAEEALRNKEEILRLALKAGHSGTFDWDAKTNENRWSDELLDLYGLRREEFGGGSEDWLACLVPEDREAGAAAIQHSLATGTFMLDFRIRRRDNGEIRWMAGRAQVLFDAARQPVRMLGINVDITDLKQAEQEIHRLNAELEERVRERTAELAAANRELEGFTFAASHDLKGPLTRLESFSRLLESRYRDRLEGDGLLFLDFIRQNALRLTQLVDDLLSHARVSQQELGLQSVDVQEVVNAALLEQTDMIRTYGAEIKLALPPISALADAHLLLQVLGNLLENALKYSAQSSPPRVEIGGHSSDSRCCVWVRDNGIGFDMKYRERIFEIFRRLHTYNEFPGNGLGLALVRRAMERMGGKVWAESEPGQGATFFLELQSAQACELVGEQAAVKRRHIAGSNGLRVG